LLNFFNPRICDRDARKPSASSGVAVAMAEAPAIDVFCTKEVVDEAKVLFSKEVAVASAITEPGSRIISKSELNGSGS